MLQVKRNYHSYAQDVANLQQLNNLMKIDTRTRIKLTKQHEEFHSFLEKAQRSPKSKQMFVSLLKLIHEDTIEKNEAVVVARKALEEGRSQRIFREYKQGEKADREMMMAKLN